MRKHFFGMLILMIFLAGCGTLSVNVELGDQIGTGPRAAPMVSKPSETDGTDMAQAPAPTGTPSVTASATATPTTAVARAVDIALGKSDTCAVFENGRVKCWGLNEHGQLGNGGLGNSNIPVEVKGLEDVKALAAGRAHTCALTRAGGVKCWGYGKYGELGNGGTADSKVPVAVGGLASGVIAIEAGDDHACAVTALGEVLCWGYNQYGQLGDGTTTSRGMPVKVQGLAGGMQWSRPGGGTPAS